MNKKGNILDVFYIMLFLTVFGMVSIVSYKIMTDAQDKMSDNLSSPEAGNASAHALEAIGNLDKVFAMIAIGLLIATAIGAYFVDTHPVFFVASLLMMILFMLIVPVFSSTFQKFQDNPSVSTAAASFTITDYFMDKLPMFFVLMCTVVVIAMYAKYRSGGGQI